MGAFKTPYIISPGDPMSAVPIAANFSELEAFLSGANLDQTNIAIDGVGTEQIAANAVTAEQIKDGEVSPTKLAPESKIHHLGAGALSGNTVAPNDGNYNGWGPQPNQWNPVPVAALPKWTAPCACRVFFSAQVIFREATPKSGVFALAVVNGDGLSWPQNSVSAYGVTFSQYSAGGWQTASINCVKDVAKGESITPTLVGLVTSAANNNFVFLKNVGNVSTEAIATGFPGGQLTAYAIPL